MNDKIEELIVEAKANAKNVKEIVILAKQVKECEDELAVLYYELGTEAYQAAISDKKQDMDIFDEIVEEITAKKKQYVSKKAKLHGLCGRTECPNCGEVTSDGFDFCPFCGAKLFDVVIEDKNK